jgi:ketosteroid isomerase-like protein
MTTRHTPSASAPEVAGPVRDPERFHQNFIDACNAGDIDRLLGLYEADAIVVENTGISGRASPPSAPTSRGCCR